jgi:hypothetical protein
MALSLADSEGISLEDSPAGESADGEDEEAEAYGVPEFGKAGSAPDSLS